jgi:hypothetical protein
MNDLIQLINTELDTTFPEVLSKEDIFTPLSEYINHLINNDFQKLLYHLYRIDISEQKLQKLLADNPDKNAGDIIAHLIIERQLQKLESRKQYKERPADTDEEKW